jgi:hypothetical protein
MATLVNTYSANSGASPTGTGSALVTSSFTPANGEILVVKLSTWVNNIAMTAPTGGSQTFVQRVRHLPPSDGYCFVAIYTAVVSGSPTNMTVTSTNASGTVIKSMVVERWSQATLAGSPVTVRQSYTSPNAPNINFTTTAANSKVSLLCAEYLGVNGTATYRGTSTESFAYRVSGSFNGFHWYQSVATASTVAVGMTSPTGQQWNIAGIELLNGDTAIEQDIGLVSSVESINQLGRSKSKALGTVIDTHGVWELSRRKSYDIGLGLGEAASALSLNKTKTLGVGIVHGSDSALVQGRSKSHVLGVEGDTSSIIGGLSKFKTKGLGLVESLESTQSLGRLKALSVGFVSDVSSIDALSRAKSRSMILLAETASARGIGRSKERAVGHVGETGTAWPPLRSKALGLGLPGGSGSVHNLAVVKALMLSLVSSHDLASEVLGSKSRLLGLVHEIDTVFTFREEVELGLVRDAGLVHGLGVRKTRGLGVVIETSDISGLSRAKSLALGTVSEVDSLEILGRIKSLVLGELLGHDSLESLVSSKARLLGLLNELDHVNELISNTEFIDRTGPLTDGSALRVSRMNRYGRT